MKQVYSRFDVLKPFFPLLKWYHQTPNPQTGNLLTAPCTFSAYRPILQFEVESKMKKYVVTAFVSIQQFRSPLQQFKRTHYLLESRNEYFVLSYKDYQTLEWLEAETETEYSFQAQAFIEKILVRLEADYAVNRNNLFPVTEIKSQPVNRVVLSEISSSFLVLTPQWLLKALY